MKHRFTNVYRASDRVSQFLIREVIYDQKRSEEPREILFRILLFKLFNKIDTWHLLESRFGPLSWATFDLRAYDQFLTQAMASGRKLYSGAYIIPPVKWSGSDGVKHRGHLHLIDAVLRGDLTEALVEARTLESVFSMLKQLPSFGDFLAFQMAIDLNYSKLIDFSENSFVVAGPGARDGIAKCFENSADFAAEDVIEMVCDRQEREFERLGLPFRNLWGRPLQLIDCQNIFCEISKYARVAHPTAIGTSGRSRIKQIFNPSREALLAWYPPKWGLNDRLPTFPSVRTSLI